MMFALCQHESGVTYGGCATHRFNLFNFFMTPFSYKCVHKIEEGMLFFFSNIAILLIYGKVCALFCVFAHLEPFYSL